MTKGKLKGHHGGAITFAGILDENGCSAVSLPKHQIRYFLLWYNNNSQCIFSPCLMFKYTVQTTACMSMFSVLSLQYSIICLNIILCFIGAIKPNQILNNAISP